MSLTAEQKAARAGKLTASRVAVLMNGDAEGILRLYREMIGEIEEENLEHVWPVQLGAATEQLQLDWFERKNHPMLIERRGEVVTWPRNEAFAATLDGWITDLHIPIECKHVGGWEPMEIIIDRYQPQLQWQMLCTEAPQCALSTIMGARDPVVDYIDRHAAYQAEMVERAENFMMCVTMRDPPVDLPKIEPPINAEEVVDFSTSNAWITNAVTWLDNKIASEDFEAAKKVLKSMVPPGAKRVFGGGVRITRDRADRLHIREDRT